MRLGHMSESGMQILAKDNLLCEQNLRILGSVNNVFLGNYIAISFQKRFIEKRAH